MLQDIPTLPPTDCTSPLWAGICGSNGVCTMRNGVPYCKCEGRWTNYGGECNYEAKSKLVTFLLSFFVGGLGVDWFFLAEGNGGYIAGGVFKLLTGGCCGIWSLVDWIRVVANGFPDGNGVALANDM